MTEKTDKKFDITALCLAITNHSPHPMAMVEGAMRVFRYGNPAFCALMGKSQHELLNRPLHELLPDKDTCLALVDRVYKTRVAESYTEKDPNKPHPVFWSYTMWPVEDCDALVGLMIQVTESAQVHSNTVAMNEALVLSSLRQHELTETAENSNSELQHEITERKRVEKALRESEELYRDLFNSIDEGFCVLEMIYDRSNRPADYRFVEVNPAFEVQSGLAGALGKRMLELIPHIEPHWFQLYGEVARTGKPLRKLEKSKALGRWFNVFAFPLKDTNKTKVAVLFTNVTELKEAEEALRENEQRFRELFRSSPMGVFVCDLDGVINEYNPRAVELWGGDISAWDGIHCGALKMQLPDDNENSTSPDHPIMEVLGNGCPKLNVEMVIVRPDESRLPVMVSFAVLKDREGKVTGAITSFMDISERKQAEALRDQMLNTERTAREEVEQAGHAKDEFLALLSHELRTPLNAILGWAQLLKEETPDEASLKTGLSVIERSANMQANLIEDLLDMSRIISGKLKLDMVSLNLPEVVDLALAMVQMTASNKKIIISKHIDPSFEPMNGDPVRLKQVIWNICSNAIKFTPPGGHIELKVANMAEGAEIKVADNGQGIRPEFLPQVFERFAQADGSTTRRAGGLGLGLSICRSLVELHGGTITAESPGEGMGATFTVRLPANTSSDTQTIDSSTGSVLDELTLENVRVLVVDDDVTAGDLMRRIFEKRLAVVEIAHSADEALALMANARYDIVVSDIGMPEKDGYDFIRELRDSDLSSRNAPAVAVTAFAHPEDRARALQAGYNSYVPKPVKSQELLLAVSRLVV